MPPTISRPSSSPSAGRGIVGRWWFLALLIGLTFGVLFARSFLPHYVLFSNDGPLGQMAATENLFPARFTGTWRPLAWLGGQAPAASINLTNLLLTILPPILYSKFYAPLTLFFAGLCAWLFFRQLKLSPLASVIGGLATALNMHFFSVACWGQGTWDVAVGMAFLAMSAIATPHIKQFWGKAVLAGLAIGVMVMEAFDVGAILSVFIGGFVFFWCLITEGSAARRITIGVVTEALAAGFALFIASHTLSTLVQTQVEGITGTGQDVQTRETRWVPATRWSLPKAETIEIMVPGVMGYRTSQHIDIPDHSSAYWGKIGEDSKVQMLESPDLSERSKALDQLNAPEDVRQAILGNDTEARMRATEQTLLRSGASRRFVGTGEYAGILVCLLALFGLACSFRRDGLLVLREKLIVWFWGAAALFSLTASWGKFFFVYAILFRLPYMSTIRNPIKFLHPFQIGIVILAAFGAECLCRYRAKTAAPRSEAFFIHILHWLKKAPKFDKNWAIGLGIAIVLSIVGWGVLVASRQTLVAHLTKIGFSGSLAAQIAEFNSGEILWFIGFLAVSVLVIVGVLSGAWGGQAAKWAGVYLGAILIFDLSRADSFWVHYQDASEKLSMNPVTDFLRDKPYEHRVIGRLEPFGPGSGITQGFGQLYYVWLQNDFPYHDIQTLDFAQMPRVPDLDREYSTAFKLKGTEINETDLFPAMRLWQLTNTRYILGPAPTSELINDRVPEAHHSLRVLSRLTIIPKENAQYVVDYSDSTVEISDKGSFALIEYDEALPRAKLYADWQTTTNNDEALRLLSSKEFDPTRTALVASDTPVAQGSSNSTADPGTVSITDYQPKRVQLQADAKAPSILLLNDRYDPGWRVDVDGQPAPLLRCNDIMRGVYLTTGSHQIDFRFRSPLRTLYLNIAAILVGLVVSGFLFVTNRTSRKNAPTAPPSGKREANPPPAPAARTAPVPASVVAAPAVAAAKANGGASASVQSGKTPPARGKSAGKQKPRRSVE